MWKNINEYFFKEIEIESFSTCSTKRKITLDWAKKNKNNPFRFTLF